MRQEAGRCQQPHRPGCSPGAPRGRATATGGWLCVLQRGVAGGAVPRAGRGCRSRGPRLPSGQAPALQAAQLPALGETPVTWREGWGGRLGSQVRALRGGWGPRGRSVSSQESLCPAGGGTGEGVTGRGLHRTPRHPGEGLTSVSASACLARYHSRFTLTSTDLGTSGTRRSRSRRMENTTCWGPGAGWTERGHRLGPRAHPPPASVTPRSFPGTLPSPGHPDGPTAQ